MFDAKISGMAELDRKLQKWVKQVGNKVIRGAVNAAANPVVKEARRLAPKESGALREALKVGNGKKVIKHRRTGVVQAVIGPGANVVMEYKGTKRRPANYAHLLEFGHGTTSARPFMRPAMDAKQGEALKIFEDRCRTGMEKEAAKL